MTMDRLLVWSDLGSVAEGAEGTVIPAELRGEIRVREAAFIMDRPQTLPPLLVIRFVASHRADEECAVTLRESDLHGTIGGNVDSILRTCPEDRPDILVMRGTL